MLRLARNLLYGNSFLDDSAPVVLDAPPGALWTTKLRQLTERAVAAANAGCEDEETIQQLSRAAGKRKPAALLTLAANNVKFEGRCDENEVDNRAWRLLVAAATGREITKPDETTKALFREVRRIQSLPLADAFAVLAASEPDLDNVRGYVARIASSLPVDQGHQAGPTAEPLWRFFDDRLEGLVGEGARQGATTPVLATYAALDVCLLFLAQTYREAAS